VETANVWHVSSFNLGIHLPYPFRKELKQHNSHFILGEGIKETSVIVSLNDKQIIRQRGTGKCTIKSFGFLSQKDTPCSAWSHKPGKRIKSSCSASHKPYSLEMQPKCLSQIRPALNCPCDKKRRGSTVR
jgi:hypothetical protein